MNTPSIVLRTFTVAFLAAMSARVNALTVSVAPSGNIQSAIDQVAAAGGGTVNITSGTATITASLRMKTNVVVNGAGNPTTTLNAGGDFTMFVNDVEGESGVTLENIKLAGRGSTGSTSCLGYVISALTTAHTNIKGINIQLLNFGGSGCLLKRANNSSISNCNFHDNGADLYSHNLYIRECTSTNVSGSSLNNSPYGSGFHLAGVTTGGSIKTTTLNTNGEDGMNLQDSPSNYTVDGCTTDNNRIATAGRGDGIGINAQTGTGTIQNCTSTGNVGANYQIGSGYTQSNNH